MPLPEVVAESVLRTTALRNCLDSLGDRERRVLDLRYALDDGRPRAPLKRSALSSA
jgi:DNA-directed RNA polymerase sigma subunit (sigma70/sigma32)